MIDSVFEPLLYSAFDNEQPLIPAHQIETALDAIENPVADAMLRVLHYAADSLLQRATPFLSSRDPAGIYSLSWAVGVQLQQSIVSVWRSGFLLGAQHMIAEIKAGIPKRSHFARFDALSDALAEAMQLSPAVMDSPELKQAIYNRAIHLAGSFSDDQLSRLKGNLIGAIVPDADGNLLSREELQTAIEKTLGVGRGRAQTIARTETTAAYNTARVQTALQTSYVTHFRFVAILDGRTSDICRSRSGLIVAADDQAAIAANQPPLHPRCRSMWSPLLTTINPEHADWAADPARDPANRELAALPKGWRTT